MAALFCPTPTNNRAVPLDNGAGPFFRPALPNDGAGVFFHPASLNGRAPLPYDDAGPLFRATVLGDSAGALFCPALQDDHSLEVLQFFCSHPSSTPHWLYPPSFFLVTFFPHDIFQLPSFTYLKLFPFLKYTAMAPPSRVSPYYYEFYDKILILGANLEEHRAGAIHRGLLQALMKMIGCQLQVFRKDLKVNHHRQKLLTKSTILEVSQDRWNPTTNVFLLSQLFYRGFFYKFFLFFLSFEMIRSVIKITSTYFFPLCVGTPPSNKPYIGGLCITLRSSDIFEKKRLISLVLSKIIATPLLEEWEDDIHSPEMGAWESSGTLATSEFNCKGQNTLP